MLLVIEIQTKKQGLLASSYSAYAIDCKNIRDLPYAEGLEHQEWPQAAATGGTPRGQRFTVY